MRILKDAPVDRGRRRILLLSYHFPPAETAGALRWQKLAAPLSEAGWTLDVVTLDPDTVTGSGLRALESLPADTRVFGVPEGQIRTRRYTKSLSRRIKTLRRAWTHAPNQTAAPGAAPSRPGSLHCTEVGWRPAGESIRRAYGAIFKLMLELGWVRSMTRTAVDLTIRDEAEYDLLLTCGPPHLVHVAGLQLHRRTGIPFVMDMRDPWRFLERIPEAIASPIWIAVSRLLEERCTREAALVITNTEPAAALLRQTYTGQGPFVAVRNGSDDVRQSAGNQAGPFLVVFAGSIYLDRDPRPLFRAVARLVSEQNLGPADFRVLLVGNVAEFDGQPVRELAASASMADFLELRPGVPRDELAGILEQASILVSLPQDSHLAIPSKIYEYAEYPAWILAVASPESATGRLLEDSEVDVAMPGSTDSILAVLNTRFDEYSKGVRPTAIGRDPRFSRALQAQKLVDLLNRIMARNQPPASTAR